MYFYISFLRPPPYRAPLTKPLYVTLQIANDLRTELFPDSQDIYFSWILSPTSQPHRATPSKLTTWRPTNTYKEIPVPLPPGRKEGQRWQLALTAESRTDAHIVNLISSDVAKIPLPVLSLPILFTTKTFSEEKQEQLERVYELPTDDPSKRRPSLILQEHNSFDLDKKVWDSGIGLSSWLMELYWMRCGAPDALTSILFSPEPKKILELGAGIGVVSLFLSTLCSNCTIVTTDLPSAIRLISYNVDTNSNVTLSPLVPAVLDFDIPLSDDIVTHAPFDLIVMSDVTYNPSSFPSLIKTLESLMDISKSVSFPPPVILMGYKERDQQERTLWKMARGIGIEFDRVGERAGWGGSPVEVWLGRLNA